MSGHLDCSISGRFNDFHRVQGTYQQQNCGIDCVGEPQSHSVRLGFLNHSHIHGLTWVQSRFSNKHRYNYPYNFFQWSFSQHTLFNQTGFATMSIYWPQPNTSWPRSRTKESMVSFILVLVYLSLQCNPWGSRPLHSIQKHGLMTSKYKQINQILNTVSVSKQIWVRSGFVR